MPEEMTGTSSASAAETASSGTAAGADGRTNQESKGLDPNRVSELEQRAARADKLEGELQAQVRRAEELERNLKAQQKNTTAKLQEAAELRRRANSETAMQAELVQVRTYMQRLADTLLEEDQRKLLQMDMREAQIKFREQMQAQQAQATRESFDPEAYKQQLFVRYASDSTVDVNDPRIDWAGDTQNLEQWLPRFRQSITKIERENQKAEQENLADTLRRQSEEAVRAANQRAADLEANLEEAKKAAKKDAQREAEERLRAAGVDVGSTATPDGGQRRLSQELEEDVPDSLLYTNPREYQKRLAEKHSKTFRTR